MPFGWLQSRAWEAAASWLLWPGSRGPAARTPRTLCKLSSLCAVHFPVTAKPEFLLSLDKKAKLICYIWLCSFLIGTQTLKRQDLGTIVTKSCGCNHLYPAGQVQLCPFIDCRDLEKLMLTFQMSRDIKLSTQHHYWDLEGPADAPRNPQGSVNPSMRNAALGKSGKTKHSAPYVLCQMLPVVSFPFQLLFVNLLFWW